MADDYIAPKAFISYAWTSKEHKDWVRELAERLVENGVDVTLDQWNLSAGHDAYVFMESMVSNPEITKVIIICDNAYVQKAKARKGGVGTEAQILSPELYSKAHDQDKFVVVSRELAPDGEPCRPTFYKSRIYISMIDDSSFESQYEELLRWLLGKPLRQKPPLGRPPELIVQGSNSAQPRVSTLADSIVRGSRRGGAEPPNLATFMAAAVAELKEFTPIAHVDGQHFDDQVFAALENMLPLSNRICEVFASELASDSPEVVRQTLRLLEQCSNLCVSAEGWATPTNWSLDHHKFFTEELLCRVCGIALRAERFDVVWAFVDARYVSRLARDYDGPKTVGFEAFQWGQPSLEKRNERLQLRRLSLKADLLKSRSAASPLDFDEFMQADFVLYLNAMFRATRADQRDRWWPKSLLYATHYPPPFPLFVRAESAAFAKQLAAAFGFADGAILKAAIERVPTERNQLPRWEFEAIDPRRLANFDNLLKFS